jgi:hypothetical protein
MLILRRKEGQWVEITHKSGDTIRLRVYNIRARNVAQLDVAFDDDAHNFVIQRPERAEKQLQEGAAVGATVAVAMNPQHGPVFIRRS